MGTKLRTIQPCSFNGVECDPTAVPGDEPHSGAFNALFYFSFVTISTLGYGDVTPASDATRVLAAMEAVVGQLFLVVLLARMVGLMGRRTSVAVGDE